MRQAGPGILAVSIIVAALITTSCKDVRQSPLASFPPQTAGDPKGVGRIVIAGNVIFSGIGETGQFTATVIFNDGSSRDVTADGRWQSSDTRVASVSGTGEARIVGLGTCVVSFEYEKHLASVNVRAANTFTVVGRVREPGSGGLPGVVVVETASGRSAVSSANGQFALSDVPRRLLRLKAEKDGYETREVETAEEEIDLPMQRVVRLTAGETVKPADLAPNEVPYAIGKEVCICRLIRVAVPRAGTVRVRVSWPTMGAPMRLFAEGLTVSGEDGLSADVPVHTAREVVMYFGWMRQHTRDYVAFTFETTMR